MICDKCKDEVSRLVAAARKEDADAMTAAYEQAIPGQQAAARLAGRLEQAEKMHVGRPDSHNSCGCCNSSICAIDRHTIPQIGERCQAERDRLRREAGKPTEGR